MGAKHMPHGIDVQPIVYKQEAKIVRNSESLSSMQSIPWVMRTNARRLASWDIVYQRFFASILEIAYMASISTKSAALRYSLCAGWHG